MELHYLVIALIAFSVLCVVPLGLLVIRRLAQGIQSARLERSVRKNEHLLRSMSGGNGPVTGETLARLDALGDGRLVERLIDGAALAAGSPPGVYRDVYDAAGVTNSYLAVLQKSKAWKKRAFAAEKLGLIGSAAALPALLTIIRDVKNEDEDVRGAALRALGRIRDERAIPFLIEALGYPDTWLPPRIGEILVSIGEPSIAHLERELRHNHSEHVRMWAAEILGWLQATAAAAALIDALSDISPEVRAKAAGALGKIKEDRAVYRLLELLVSDPAPFVRVKASQALGIIGHPAVIDYLINTLKDPEWWVRVRAVEALEKLGEKAVAALLPALEDEDPEVRKRSAMALERMGYVEKILDEYARPEFKPDVRRILLLVAGAGIVESLGQKLETPNRTLTKRIVRLFGEARVKEAAGPLLELLLKTPDWSIRARVIESLGKIGANEAIPHLVRFLRDEEGWVRRSTVEALGRLESQDIADDVANILDDPSPIARESALEALLRLNVSRHARKIEGLLADPNARVRQAAIKAMRGLGLPLNGETGSALLADAADEVKGEAIAYFSHAADPGRAADIVRLLPRGSPPLVKEIVSYFEAVHTMKFAELRAAVKVDELRPDALAALVEIAALVGDEDAHLFIAAFTESAEPLLRERALASLARFGVGGHETIFERGLFDPAERVRIAVLAALSADPRPGLLERALELSNDPDENVRTALALALGASGLREFGPQARRMLDDPSVKVNAGALISLAAFDDPALLEQIRTRWSMEHLRSAIAITRREPLFKPMLDRISRDATRSNNLEVTFVLAENETEFTQDLIRRIRESHDPATRMKAIDILAALPAEEFLTSILGIMKRDPLAEIRIRAMEIVSRTKRTDEAVSAFSSMLVDPAPAVRSRAAEILGRFGTPQALEALLHVLDTSERKFREVVTTSLSALLAGNPEKFGELLKSIPETKTRKIGMIWLMGKTRKRGAIKFLANLLDDEDPDVRASAVGALAKFKRKRLLPRFETLAYDPSERVRAATVNAVAGAGGPAALALCEKMLEDVDEFVRRRAAVGLARIDERRAVSILREKAAAFPELRSYARGILFATGAPCDESVGGDPLAKSIVAELCPEEETRRIFQTSPDRKKRLHAFRVLALAGVARTDDIAAAALRDPSAEIREEAALYAE
ncbi:MAG: HEAT repeat domain-containing protein [Candidatus Krumholzibacteriaceae bacterium]|jgi:HEAT repeat protein